MNSATILKLLIVGLDILKTATDARTRQAYSEWRNSVQTFINENRDPTENEWNELFSKAEDLHKRLQDF